MTRTVGMGVGMGETIERYVRCSVDVMAKLTGPVTELWGNTRTVKTGSIEGGLQLLRGESPGSLREESRAGLDYVRAMFDKADFDTLSQMLEEHIAARWPGRGWFVEVWNIDECVSQVYAPCGMPRVK